MWSPTPESEILQLCVHCFKVTLIMTFIIPPGPSHVHEGVTHPCHISDVLGCSANLHTWIPHPPCDVRQHAHQHLKSTESIAHQLTSGTTMTHQLTCLCVPEVVGCLMWFTLHIYNLMYPQLNLSVRAMRLSFTSTVHMIPFFTIPHFPGDPLFNSTSTRVVCCPVFFFICCW